MNSRYGNIHFTSEEECKSKLSFHDVIIKGMDNKLVTSLYQKTTFSGVYMI